MLIVKGILYKLLIRLILLLIALSLIFLVFVVFVGRQRRLEIVETHHRAQLGRSA